MERFSYAKRADRQIALVTGGSRGIGAAVVRRLGSDGATVAFSYAVSEEHAKSLVAEVAKAGGTALAIQADSADADAVKGAVAQAVDRFGRLDILVNNAGILIGGIVDDFALSDFDRMVAVNVRAVFVAIQAVVPHMSQGGRIITTGSVTADRSGFERFRGLFDHATRTGGVSSSQETGGRQ